MGALGNSPDHTNSPDHVDSACQDSEVVSKDSSDDNDLSSAKSEPPPQRSHTTPLNCSSIRYITSEDLVNGFERPRRRRFTLQSHNDFTLRGRLVTREFNNANKVFPERSVSFCIPESIGNSVRVTEEDHRGRHVDGEDAKPVRH